MGAFDNVEKVPRRVMTLFMLVDTSSSMRGDKIKSLNDAVRETVPYISDLSANNPDSEIKIAVLDFSSGCEWMYPEPISSENFKWHDLKADGLTDLGDAALELNAKLSRSAFMQEASGSFAPVILLFSDGAPTDNYAKGVNRLKNNNWFKSAIKIAVAIGEDANKKILADFTGNSELVLTVHNKDQLKKIIKFVSVTASQVASKSASAGIDGADTKKDEMLEKIEQHKESGDLRGIDIGTEIDPSSEDAWGSW